MKQASQNRQQNAASLTRDIQEARTEGTSTHAVLETSDRVLARVTDGIYREPSSALRELISNAYDADATAVTISTDLPRFNRISVADDGAGMDEAGVANLILHIGGSVKRTAAGANLHVVNEKDPSRSPGGRPLIGKIGIGLFSVAQLTRHFQIITKKAGNDYRLVADVTLHTYTEEEIESSSGDETFKTGDVWIRGVRAEDRQAHGTEIVLLDLRQQARNILRSRELWMQLSEDIDEVSHDVLGPAAVRPTYHIGEVDPETESFIKNSSKYPWDAGDTPTEKMRKLHRRVLDEESKTANPEITKSLDNYLEMVWWLALSVPLPYISKHPFELTGSDGVYAFALGNTRQSRAEYVELEEDQTIASKLPGLTAHTATADEFDVFIDGVKLARPITFEGKNESSHAINRPLLFVGTCSPDLSAIPVNQRGGDLSFDGYIFWRPKIVPKEHNGVLVRIHGASGTLFDETFMSYQVSEITRLRQITAEIFVNEGLESALNIDRESFNYSHPHYQILTRWLHQALRQFANRHKALAQDARRARRANEQKKQRSNVVGRALEEWTRRHPDDELEPPEIELVDDITEAEGKRRETDRIVLVKNAIITDSPERSGRVIKEDKVRAVALTLASYGVLEDLPYEDQEKLIHAIVDIFDI